MRRLIITRPARLALVAALAAGLAAGLVVVRRRRRTATRPPGPDGGRESREAIGAGANSFRTGPEPVLGWATDEDLKRYARPEGGAPIAGLLAALAPIVRGRGAKARRRTAVLAALGLLVLASQALENAVFRGPPESSSGETAVTEPCRAAGCPAGQVLGRPATEPYLPEPYPPGLGAEDGVRSPAGEPYPYPGAACALPEPRPMPVVRPVSRHVRTAVNRQWRRIERWLKAHAPKTYASLNGPASPRRIAEAEALLGTRIPGSLRASLLRHDGTHGVRGFRFPPSLVLLGARDIVVERQVSCLAGPGLPFARDTDDETGGHLAVDPHGGGVLSLPDQEIGWSSYHALLRATADALVTGEPLAGYLARVRNGGLEWTEA